MSAAESLRTVCAVAQVPGVSPSGIALAFALGRELGLTLESLPQLPDAELGRILRWDTSQLRVFRDQLRTPLDQFSILADRGIHASTALDAGLGGWPIRLPSTPWLFYRGDLSIINQPAIGFSGSRDACEAALDIARGIATHAVSQEMTVVSGGARGVDVAAHMAALAAGGTTVVLVPQGLDTWWVPAALTDPQTRDRMLVVSTDLPWAPWTTVSAMQRNRAIVDLSEVITIPQAGVTGGSHSTGVYALGRKRNLWVADLGDAAPGNQLLLGRGAKPIPINDGAPDLARMRALEPVVPAQQSLF